MSDANSRSERRGPAWPQVAWFLGLAFGLAYLADLVLFLNGGLANRAASLVLQFRMMTPAFAALSLGFFFFKDSALHRSRLRGAARVFLFYFLALALLQAVGAGLALATDLDLVTLGQGLLGLNALGLLGLLVAFLRERSRAAFAAAGLAGGKARVWLLYGLGLVAFWVLQAFLNRWTKLGVPADIMSLMPPEAAGSMPKPVFLLSFFANVVLVGPFLGLVISFGEEYGWRGYLQAELVRLGRRRGVLLLGVVWGVWHWPVIWMGYNYPGHPILGSLAMVAVCVILAFFLAHAVLKAKGVWAAAYLHALNNQALSFTVLAIARPADNFLSFGIGLPGLAMGAVVVLFLLRDPVWKEGEETAAPDGAPVDPGLEAAPGGAPVAGAAEDGRRS